MAKKLMGFEGKLYWGAAGSTAATELTIARDVSYTIEKEEGDVSDRGNIINLKDVVGVNLGLQFDVNNKEADTFISTARTAAVAGTAIALRTRDKASGWGIDGDFIIGIEESQELRAAQRIRITASPTDKDGRTPAFA